MNNNILEIKEVSKSFHSVQALKSVSMEVRRGEIHGLVGENGAGKSTLLKILAGIQMPDSGEISLNGQPVVIHNPSEAGELGLSFIHQELFQIPYFSVAENFFIGRPYPRNKLGFINWRQVYQAGEDNLAQFKIEKTIAKKPLGSISVAYRYILAIERALHQKCKLIFMDEPTAALTDEEVDNLFKSIEELKNKGISIVYVSHKLAEIFKICDRVTVIRDGRVISTETIKEIAMDKVIFNMLGETLKEKYPKREIEIGDEILSVRNVKNAHVNDISFNLKSREILGVIGLVGSGRTELARLMLGLDKKDSGDILVKGKKVEINSPREAFKEGICLIPEDRQVQGLVLNMSISENTTLSNLKNYCFGKLGLLKYAKENAVVKSYVESMKIKAGSIFQKVRDLSGGNQQKVVIARGFDTKSSVYIFDESTNGIDVGAKTEIYLLVHKLAREGSGIIFITTEVEEALGLCDRIVILRDGAKVGEFASSEINAEGIAAVMQRGTKTSGVNDGSN